MTRELIVKSNTELDELAQAVYDANSIKKKPMVEAQNMNCELDIET